MGKIYQLPRELHPGFSDPLIKPPNATINYNHWLMENLRAAWLHNGAGAYSRDDTGRSNQYDPLGLTMTGATLPSFERDGLQFDGLTSQLVDSPDREVTIPYTVLTVFVPTLLTQGCLTCNDFNEMRLYAQTDGRLNVRHEGTQAAAIAGTLTAGVLNTGAMRVNAGFVDAYANGVFDSTAGSHSTVSPGGALGVGARAGGTVFFDGWIGYTLELSEFLSLEKLDAWNADPYGFLEPSLPMQTFVPAAGGVNTTIAVPTGPVR